MKMLGEALAMEDAMEKVMSQKWVVAVTAVWLGIGAVGVAQDRATVQMRDGRNSRGGSRS
jgi:hypothetical protein